MALPPALIHMFDGRCRCLTNQTKCMIVRHAVMWNKYKKPFQRHSRVIVSSCDAGKLPSYLFWQTTVPPTPVCMAGTALTWSTASSAHVRKGLPDCGASRAKTCAVTVCAGRAVACPTTSTTPTAVCVRMDSIQVLLRFQFYILKNVSAFL